MEEDRALLLHSTDIALSMDSRKGDLVARMRATLGKDWPQHLRPAQAQ